MHAPDASQTMSMPHDPTASLSQPPERDGSAAPRPRPSRARRTYKWVLESNSYGRRFRAFYWRLRDDLDANDSLFAPGFQALMVYRFGAWHRTLPTPLRLVCALIYRPTFIFIRNVYGIEIPATARIGRRLRISHQHGIVLHPQLVMGDDCVIRQNVTIGGALSHHRGAIFGNRVDVAAGAIILGRVRIGDDARIGPNAVVTMNVPAGATAFAAPARIINVRATQSRPRETVNKE
jgi:serine O-acetyltransferase